MNNSDQSPAKKKRGMNQPRMGPGGSGTGMSSGGSDTGMSSGSAGAGMGSGGAGAGMGSGGSGAGMAGMQRAELPTQRTCGTMDVHARLMRTVPRYAVERAQIEQATLEFLRGDEATLRSIARAGGCRIPVVVHVVWNQPNQNVSDAQIQSQIDVLNRDFRILNPDISTVPSVFQGLIGNPNLEFFLATQDPNGSPSSGIVRTRTNETSFVDDDRVKFNATGGSDAWPADRYLNMWVCQLGNNLLGYAQFPGGPAATDGVVITHSGFGTTGTANPPFHLGRTATHEIGHWLDLFHIWGDDGGACVGSDQVSDTPNQGDANIGVPAFPHISCNNGPNGDLFMNYMDYVDDPAMVMFTQGQVARMQACLAGPRASICSGQVSGAPSASGPVVAWGSDRLDVFVIGTDSALWHKWWDGSHWGPSVTDWEYMGGICMSQPEVIAWGSDRLDVFVLGTDSGLWHKWWDGSNWGPSVTDWESLGGICTSRPEVVAWGPNRLDVFVVGTDSALWHKWWDGAAWGPSVTDWESLGGICSSRPEVVAWGPDRLDVFVLGTDNALWHKWWDGAAWGPSVTDWEYMGGTCSSPPRVVAWGPDRLDVFVLGTDHALYHKWWDGAAWGPSVVDWEYMGGICLGEPGVVSWGSDRLDVFVIGTDNAVWHKWWDGSAWGPSVVDFEYMGGICTSRPEAVAWSANRLDLFVTGTDHALWHKWWDGSAWGPSVVDWEYLGGTISDF